MSLLLENVFEKLISWVIIKCVRYDIFIFIGILSVFIIRVIIIVNQMGVIVFVNGLPWVKCTPLRLSTRSC